VSTPASPTRPGIALLTALVVVLLLTMFLSELFFATGLELRSLQSFKDSAHARRLARSVLKATEIGLLQDEVQFFSGYRQLQQVLTLSSLALEGGRLVTLDVAPLDSRFNLNDLAGLQPGKPQDLLRFEVFHNLMAGIMIPPQDPSAPATPLPAARISAIYADLMDWLDTDDLPYTAPDGTPGAEMTSYFATDPEYVPKNQLLDRLEEIRLLRDYPEAHIPWKEIERRFVVRAKSTKNDLYPEKLNANLATRDEIVEYLQARLITTPSVLSDGPIGSIQKEVNKYAENAAEIADAIVPDGQPRPVYTDGAIKNAITAAGLNGNAANQVFTAISQYYRVSIITEVDNIQANLSAVVSVNRNPADRTGKSAEIQQYYLN
jgi:type II secretory pathway component PulK